MLSVESKGPAKIGLWAVITALFVNVLADAFFLGYVSFKRVFASSLMVGFVLAVIMRFRYEGLRVKKKK